MRHVFSSSCQSYDFSLNLLLYFHTLSCNLKRTDISLTQAKFKPNMFLSPTVFHHHILLFHDPKCFSCCLLTNQNSTTTLLKWSPPSESIEIMRSFQGFWNLRLQNTFMTRPFAFHPSKFDAENSMHLY